jgi:outer membrane protein assembly factor BamB
MPVRRFFLFLAVLVVTSPAAAENWPQWRGAKFDGVSKETKLPIEWSETKNIAWKLPLPGMGGSTPVIWAERIFLTSEDGSDLVLLCVNTDGKELWKRKLGTKTRYVRNDEGNGASASPCTDGKHVWATVGSGEVACFDVDGGEVWKFNLQDRFARFGNQFGMHSTPLLDGDRLYLQLLRTERSWVVALDKNTGKEAWKVERKSDAKAECLDSYASPTLWRRGDQAYLITHGNDYAIAHRLEDGQEIWRAGGLNPKDKYNFTLRFVASPLATPDLIVIPSAKNGPVVGLKPDANGTVVPGSPNEQWRRSSNTPDVPSPLLHDGLVYLCRENGALICLDAQTGQELYNQRIHSARYRASPVYAAGHVYCTARDGTVTVVKAGPKFEAVAVNKLPDQISASPAVSSGRIYLRGFDALYAIGAPHAK